MKVLLLKNTTARGDFGGLAAYIAIAREIKNLDHELSFFAINDSEVLKYMPTTAMEFFDQRILAKFMAHNHKLCALIKTNDLLLVNGEGALHGTKKEAFLLLYIMYIAKSIFTKNVQVINHSVYPHNTLSIEYSEIFSLYKKVYSSLDFVAIREPLSAALMRDLGVSVGEGFDCLPLYIKHYYKPKLILKQDDIILLSGSSAWTNTNNFATCTPASCLKSSLVQIVKALHLKMAEGYRIKFLYRDLDYVATEDQEMICYFRSLMGKSFSMLQVKTIDAWLAAIEGASLLISGRFHDCIAAACLGTKFIALNSDTPEMTGLMQVLAYPKPLMYTDLKLELKLTKAIARAAVYRTSFYNLTKLCNMAQDNFRMLRKMSKY